MKVATSELDAVCALALAKWDARGQVDCLLEEMAELQKEIIKNRRGRDNIAAMAEEVADVEIMLHQLKLIFGLDEQVEQFQATEDCATKNKAIVNKRTACAVLCLYLKRGYVAAISRDTPQSSRSCRGQCRKCAQ